MKDGKERKIYERPAVVFEKHLEALAADCGTGVPPDNVFEGSYNCKGEGQCTITFS